VIDDGHQPVDALPVEHCARGHHEDCGSSVFQCERNGESGDVARMHRTHAAVAERYAMTERDRARRERSGLVERRPRTRKVCDPFARRERAGQRSVALLIQQKPVDARGDRLRRAHDLVADRVDAGARRIGEAARGVLERFLVLSSQAQREAAGAHGRPRPQCDDRRRGAEYQRARDDRVLERRGRDHARTSAPCVPGAVAC
jgi:hypothetical protein